MSDLSSFAEVIQKALHAKQTAADDETVATINKNVPLLSELFATVAKAKTKQKVKPPLLENQLSLINHKLRLLIKMKVRLLKI